MIVPFAAILADFRIAYPRLTTGQRLAGDFRSEAVAAGADE
jgi:hypothetical protein